MSAARPLVAMNFDAAHQPTTFSRLKGATAVARFLRAARDIGAAGREPGEGLDKVAIELWSVVTRLVGACRSNGAPLHAAVASPPPDRATHAVNVAILAVTIGGRLNMGTAELQRLAFASLIHEVGAVRLPSSTLVNRGPLSLGEYRAVRNVPFYSREIIAGMGRDYSRVAEIVSQVNERADGTGFPRRLGAAQILPDAQVIGAADFLDSYLHGWRNGSTAHAIRELTNCPAHFGIDVVFAAVEALSFAGGTAIPAV